MTIQADDKDNIDLSELRGTAAAFENKVMGKVEEKEVLCSFYEGLSTKYSANSLKCPTTNPLPIKSAKDPVKI